MMTTEDVIAPVPNGIAMGGSELILANLKAAFPDIFPNPSDPTQDKVQVIVSRPQLATLDPERPKLLWLQDLPGDPASVCLNDATYRAQFNRIVCVSHWQQQQYAAVAKISYGEMTVIKNAVPRRVPTLPKPKFDGKLRFIYTSTPHRGLPILAACAKALADERQDWELHVYSSLHIYGWHEADAQFQPIYDQLTSNPCVTYHGSVPNAEVRDAVDAAHIFVFPSIYMETSCMAIQEALMAGCLAITTNLGALPETCGEWAWMFSIDERAEVIAERCLANMRHALDHYDDEKTQQVLELQSLYYQNFWAFESRLAVWKQTLESCIAEGPRKEMLVIE
jgi:UDP-glucose:(glucosyl)LPS alpha-1,2-glucosyltransferase